MAHGVIFSTLDSNTGKWHLSQIADEDYSYDSATSIVEGCGFTDVKGKTIGFVARTNFSEWILSHICSIF